MKNTIKLIIMSLISLVVIISGINATPLINDVTIQNVNGEYTILVSYINNNVSSGIYTNLAFTIPELGTTKNFNVIRVDRSKVLSYKLKDITNSYNLLQKGNTYSIVVNGATTLNGKNSGAFQFETAPPTQNGLGVSLDKIKINSITINPADTITVLNGQILNVNLKISANQNFDNARFMVYIEGYEHTPIITSTDIFSVVSGKTYIKSLSIKLPNDMNSLKDYKLRISGANDLSGLTYKEFPIYVDTQRNRIDILDLVMTPSVGIEAGQNFIANVRLKNRGQRSQDSIKVIVAVPELGINESSYVSNLNQTEVITSDDMLLSIPKNAKAKTYNVKVSLLYNDGYTSSVKSYPITVLAPTTVKQSDLLVNFKNNISLVAGKTTSFDIVIANPNSVSKPISINVGNNMWSNTEIKPSLAMIQGGASATFRVSITPKSAITGEKSLSLTVKEGPTLISSLDVKTYVAPGTKTNWTNIILVVLLILAIIILLSIVIKISKKEDNNDDEEEYTSSKEYY